MQIYAKSLLTEQEYRLLLTHVNTVKQVMLDIQAYGIQWLQGDDKITKGEQLHLLNLHLLHYQKFVEMIKAPCNWLDIYNILIQTTIAPINSLFICLNGLERLTNDITISMNVICSEVTDPRSPLECSQATLRHRFIKSKLLSVSSELLGCSCLTPDTLMYILKDLQCKIELYYLTPIQGLKHVLEQSTELCLTIRTLDVDMDKEMCR